MTPEPGPRPTGSDRRCPECRGTGTLATGYWRVSPLLTLRIGEVCRWCRGTGERSGPEEDRR